MLRPLAAGISLFVLHAVFAPVADADHAPVLLSDGTIVHGDWGLYRPGHMPLRFEGPYDFYRGPYVISHARRYYTTGSFYPTNKEDPGAYQRRENENGPTQSPERFYREWGAWSDPSSKEDGNKEYSDPTIYPKWDMPDHVYVPVQPNGSPAATVQPPPRPRR